MGNINSNKRRTFAANSHAGKSLKLDTNGMIAGGIVHDFNNLLTTISGYAEMIHDELPGGTALSEKVLRLRAAVSRASLLSRQLLQTGDVSSGEKSKVSINEILYETLDLLKDQAAVNIRFRSDIPGEPVYVYAAQNQLFRIFLNLFTNAIQSMNDRGGLLHVRVSRIPAVKIKPPLRIPGISAFTLITVRDTGSGIDPEVRKRIFEPGFSGRHDISSAGLGLSVVHDIIRDLDGEIRVASKTGAGTIFRIYLPIP